MNNEPWLSEPTEHLFESHGFVCFARRRTVTDTWCGYIYLPSTHPDFGRDYDDVEVHVHGGLTYADPEGDGDVWCFGFDCAHYMDVRPNSKVFYDEMDTDPFAGATWKSLDYVINELDFLAQQFQHRGESK